MIRRRVEVLNERVLLIVLDAFGLEFLHRHSDHPLVKRMSVTPLESQFPSATTAEMTTLFYDLPVEAHGLYEWHVFEPSLGSLICPLRGTIVSSGAGDQQINVGEFERIVPSETFFQTLSTASLAMLPNAIASSTFSRFACRGATVVGYDDPSSAVIHAAEQLANEFYGHALLYWDHIDAVGHDLGPGDSQFDTACTLLLDGLYSALEQAPRDITVLLTADHGQTDVSPSEIDYLEDLWPQLPASLDIPRPAGSTRDLFLHVKAERVGVVLEGLQERLEGRATVMLAANAFRRQGSKLTERLGDVLVLPTHRHQVWLRSASGPELGFRGQHGGLSPAETEVYIAEFEM